jgi:hypothetical protein
MGCTADDSAYSFEASWPQRPRVYFDPASTNAAEILSDLPIDIVDSPIEADLLWMRKGYREWYERVAPSQAINHIPGEQAMTRKGDLAYHLHRYGASAAQGGFSHPDFFQPTYRLYDPEEAAAFARQLPQADDPDNLWILKPSNLSRGRGVKIVWQFDWLRNELRKRGQITIKYEGRELDYVIQRYIKNVLLLDGRKSELRMYWLIASVDPLLVLMYPEGTARLTLAPYKLDDFSNPLIHITNVYQQKKHASFDEDAVLKWDFAKLAAYLSEEKAAGPDFVEQVLRPRLRRSLAYAVRASIERFKQASSGGYFFGLYGADFIVDDRLTPWLTEIQKGPGLSYDDAVKERLMPAMLRGAASIVLEILARKRQGESLTALSSTYGYEWVIRDAEGSGTDARA